MPTFFIMAQYILVTRYFVLVLFVLNLDPGGYLIGWSQVSTGITTSRNCWNVSSRQPEHEKLIQSPSYLHISH